MKYWTYKDKKNGSYVVYSEPYRTESPEFELLFESDAVELCDLLNSFEMMIKVKE